MNEVFLIELTQGHYAKVNLDDAKALLCFPWHVCRHRNGLVAARSVRVNGAIRLVYMHRQILDAPPGLLVDHVNHDTLDNRRSNLRLCSNQQNQWNRKPFANGFKGVGRRKPGGKWCAKINKKYIGSYATPEEAARAYDHAARKLFGEFAYCNFSD